MEFVEGLKRLWGFGINGPSSPRREQPPGASDILGGLRLVSDIREIAAGIFKYTMFLVVLHVPPLSSFK
jgi:hypothetical protein